jgi:hypothetical protein
VLGDEHWMATEWRLLPIIARFCRGESLVNELSRMFKNCLQPLGSQVAAFLRSEMEAPSECRLRQPREDFIDVVHARLPAPSHKEPHFGDNFDSSSSEFSRRVYAPSRGTQLMPDKTRVSIRLARDEIAETAGQLRSTVSAAVANAEIRSA